MNLDLMLLIDKQFLDMPFYSVRQMTWHLRNEGHPVNEKRIRRLVRLMGLMPIYQAPNTRCPATHACMCEREQACEGPQDLSLSAARPAGRSAGSGLVRRYHPCVGKTVLWGLLRKSFQIGAVWSGWSIFDERPDQQHGRRQLLEVHCQSGQEGLYFHVLKAPSDGTRKAVECLGRAMRAFDLPSVAGVDGAFVISPHCAFAAGAQDGCAVRHDVHPAGRHAPGQALRLEGAAGTVASVSAVSLAGCRVVAGREPLPCRAADHIVAGVELEPLGWKALGRLAPGRAKRRDDGFDPAVFKGGVNAANAIEPVRRDPTRGNPEGRFDGVQALVEPAGVMFLAGHDLHIDDDTRTVVNGRVLLVGRAQRGLGRGRHGRLRVRATKLLELAARARVPLGTIGIVLGLRDRIQMARDQRVHADIRPDQAGIDVNGLGRNHPGLLALPNDTRENLAEDVFAQALPDARQ